MVIKKRSDIEKYVGERYRVASEIAYTVMEFLAAQPKSKLERFVLKINIWNIWNTALLDLLPWMYKIVVWRVMWYNGNGAC